MKPFFIEVIDSDDDKRLVNLNHIRVIAMDGKYPEIYFNGLMSGDAYIRVKSSYEDLVDKIKSRLEEANANY